MWEWCPARLILMLILTQVACAIEWPVKYRLEEKTLSQEGRYGIIAWDGSDEFEKNGGIIENEITYFADIKAHKLIGEIKDSSYYWPHNHLYLSVQWSANSSWCVAEYDGRFWFNTVTLLEIGADGLKQYELGPEIKLHCDKIAETGILCHFHFSGEGRLEVAAFGTDNPKALEDRKEHNVFFRGTFDGNKGRWLATKAIAINGADSGLLETAFSPPDKSTVWDDNLAALDHRLNDIYQGLKRLVPEERFKILRQEQRDWLAASKQHERSKSEALIKARVQVLEDLLWKQQVPR